jgi:HD-like signal output (HDOD) protein
MTDPLATLLERVAEVCPLPATTHKVMALANSDRSSIAEVTRVISTDPALAAAVLRVANSAVFGAGKVDRLDSAVIRIGLRELRELAGAMSLLAAFRSQAELQIQLHDRSVVSGSIANRLAKETNQVATATAFTCGLLSEIGAMACLAVDGKYYASIWKESANSPVERIEREKARYTVSSFEIGRRFLTRNSLPDNVCNAVGTEFGADPAALAALDRITLLARHSAPIVLSAAREGAYTKVGDRLEALARQVGFENFDGKFLFDVCVRAGVLAEAALRHVR